MNVRTAPDLIHRDRAVYEISESGGIVLKNPQKFISQTLDLLVRHVQALSRFLTPHKDLQERRVSGTYFLGRAGYDLLDRLLAQIQVRCSDHQTLQY